MTYPLYNGDLMQGIQEPHIIFPVLLFTSICLGVFLVSPVGFKWNLSLLDLDIFIYIFSRGLNQMEVYVCFVC